MRERLTGTLILLYALIMMVFSVITLSSANGQYIKNRKVEKLPAFTYHTLDGQKYSDKNLKENARLMIVYFNPLCEVCQKEVKEIVSNIEYFKNIQILMISPNTKEEISSFANTFKLGDYQQITLLHDVNDQFYKEFHAIGYPSLYMYDEHRTLLDHFDSQADIREIKTAFEETTARK